MANEPSGQTWRTVRPRQARAHPVYRGLMRALGEAMYRFHSHGGRLGLPAFAVVAAGRLSRSGQPGARGWQWLRGHGVRVVINLRQESDDERQLRGFGFQGYLHLPIPDGSPPDETQALAFLRFVTDSAQWPAHLHCLAGVQRTGTLVALVRYSVEGWPVPRALHEAYHLFPGPATWQARWLKTWAAHHPPGEWPWRLARAGHADQGK